MALEELQILIVNKFKLLFLLMLVTMVAITIPSIAYTQEAFSGLNERVFKKISQEEREVIFVEPEFNYRSRNDIDGCQAVAVFTGSEIGE